MVVGKNHSSGVDGKAAFDHLAWVDAGAIDRAAKQLLVADHGMLIVQKQAGKHLVRQTAQLELEELPHLGGRAQDPTTGEPPQQITTREFQCGLQLGPGGVTQSMNRAESLPICVQQPSQVAECNEKLSCLVLGA